MKQIFYFSNILNYNKTLEQIEFEVKELEDKDNITEMILIILYMIQ